MTKDFVVSCWWIPTKKPRQNTQQYIELLGRYADAIGGDVVVLDGGEDFLVITKEFSLAPGDTLCKYASGRFGVRRGVR